jgi:phage baseplate assembly protein W
MASVGVNVQIPLSISSNDGPYTLIKDYQNSVKQNLKMLILTSQGERIMHPVFGVGIRKYLFEPLNEVTKEIIRFSIVTQAAIYMPYIVGMQIEISNASDMVQGTDEKEVNSNTIVVSISYDVVSSSTRFADSLELEIS